MTEEADPSQAQIIDEAQASLQEPARKRKPNPRPFSQNTLQRALVVALAIKDKNAGNPWPPSEVARAVGIKEKSSVLDSLARSSSMYGLTSGSRNASAMSLEKLGRDVIYAPNLEAEIEARRRAFLNVEFFAKVFEYYRGPNLPETEFLSNTLTAEFHLDKEYHEEFRGIFLENCMYAMVGASTSSPASTRASIQSDRPTSPTIAKFASETNCDGKRCFVIMPFSERLSDRPRGFFSEVFDSLIKPAAESAGFDVATANKDGSDVIQSTIISELLDADLVVADLTDHNPNVLFELGVRMAQEKPIAIIKTSDTGSIFDVDNMLRVFEYRPNLWTSTLREDLPK